MAHTKFFAVDATEATEATFLFIFIGEIDSAAKHIQCIDYNVVQVIAKQKETTERTRNCTNKDRKKAPSSQIKLKENR